MKSIEIRETKKPGLIQITTWDERFYRHEELGEFPSSAWISGYVPITTGLKKYLQEHGFEADDLRDKAGEKGRRVHNAIDILVAQKQKSGSAQLDINTPFEKDNGTFEPLNVVEIECVLSFVNWFKELAQDYDVEIIDFERADFNEEFHYAGTRDLRAKLTLKEEKKVKEDLSGTWTIDYKTSKSIQLSHIIQLSSYKHFPDCEKDRIGILQVGYKLNKRGYKFTKIEDRFDLFLAAMKFWAEDNENKRPKQYEFPQLLNL